MILIAMGWARMQKKCHTFIQVAGGSIFHVITWGVRRAIFSNEAGLGSAAIAHAAVKTDYPIREGIVASLGPLIDTIIVCTATAAIIIMSGNFGTNMYPSISMDTTLVAPAVARPNTSKIPEVPSINPPIESPCEKR